MSESRSVMLNFRVTEAQAERITLAALAAGVSVSEFLRRAALKEAEL